MIGDGAVIGFHVADPDRGNADGRGRSGEHSKDTSAGDGHGRGQRTERVGGMRAYMVSAPSHGTRIGISARAEPKRLSRDFLHANRVALRDALAVPIRAKACRRSYKAR